MKSLKLNQSCRVLSLSLSSSTCPAHNSCKLLPKSSSSYKLPASSSSSQSFSTSSSAHNSNQLPTSSSPCTLFSTSCSTLNSSNLPASSSPCTLFSSSCSAHHSSNLPASSSPRKLFSTSSPAHHACKLLVVGGGSAGCSMAAKFNSHLGKGQVTIVEPAETHYYQPMFTLVGGGMKSLAACGRPMKSVLPAGATWVKDRIATFDPDNNKIRTQDGTEINYEYMIVASGVQLYPDRVKGLSEALEDPDSGVSTNYSPRYVEKTLRNLSRFQTGNVLYTFPNTPVKCGGAPMKAVLIGEEYLRKTNRRDAAKISYSTAHAGLFPSPFYAEKILKILLARGVEVHKGRNLVEVDVGAREAVFQSGEDTQRVPYSVMHVTPPMGPVPQLATSSLVDASGYVTVDKATLQHVKYPNVFALGDCTNLPTSKTAAAVAAQSKIVYDNLNALMGGKALSQVYNGYTSCPLVTGYSKCLMAEFDYSLKPLETFPMDQSEERKLMFLMKAQVMPLLYWHLMLKGYWNGPEMFRKSFHLGGLMKQQNR